MTAVERVATSIGTAPACRALGLPRASVYRGRRPAAVTRPRPAPPRALDRVERQEVLDLLHTRFVDQAPAQVHAALLDEGTYVCSPRTMYRLLDAAHEIKERRDQVRRPRYAAPELLATRANEVWSWDITKLLGPAKWTYFYLYVILDIFSRYVVGWMLAPRESAALAERLIADTCAKQGIQPGQLTLHADRGGAMRSKPVALLLADLGVTKTHSRPHVSNDNPFSEAHFRTLKYCPQFPDRFGSIEDGRAFCQSFFSLVQPRASSQRARFPEAGGRPLRPGRSGARASENGVGRCVRGASRTLRQRTAATGRSADRRLDQPTGQKLGASGCLRNNDRPLGRPTGRPDSGRR